MRFRVGSRQWAVGSELPTVISTEPQRPKNPARALVESRFLGRRASLRNDMIGGLFVLFLLVAPANADLIVVEEDIPGEGNSHDVQDEREPRGRAGPGAEASAGRSRNRIETRQCRTLLLSFAAQYSKLLAETAKEVWRRV